MLLSFIRKHNKEQLPIINSEYNCISNKFNMMLHTGAHLEMKKGRGYRNIFIFKYI